MKRSTTVLLLSLSFASSAFAASHHFLAGLDQGIEAESISSERLVAERFYRLGAKLSVYALYCDFDNTRKYSLKFHDMWVRCEALQAQVEKTFGGFKPAYNRFERYRNEESLRFIQAPDRDAVCAASRAAFAHYVSLDGKSLKAELTAADPGQL
jgi:hypothetical protein